MKIHQLNILDNAVDSLKEALAKYNEGVSGSDKAFKFCILHLAHFFELIFKHYVSLAHPLLIYSQPFKPKLNEANAHTISLDDAVNFLTNDGKEFSKGFISDLQWLKKLRNEIEHHKFALNLEEVKEAVGRLIAAINEFDVQHADLKLGNLVDPVNVGTFDELAKTYRLQLQNATKAVEAAEKDAYKGLRHKEWGDVRFQIFTCPECDHDTLIPNGSSDTGYRCTFCENEESDEIEVSCGVCDSEWPSGEMLFEDFHGFGLKIFVCPRCSGDPDYRND